MPANAGMDDFCLSQQEKPWIPAFAGMTTCAAPVGQSFGYLVLHIFQRMPLTHTDGPERITGGSPRA
jgi:hypothetical protein